MDVVVIHIAPYDANWPMIYGRECGALRAALGELVDAIEHIGSTAVPNLASKRTIDIMIGVAVLTSIDKTIINKLKRLGYDYIQALEKEMPQRRYFQKLNDAGQHRFHLHIVVTHKPFWKTHLLLRDYLITHPTEMQDYAAHKKQLALKFKNDRPGYTKAKSKFIKMLGKKAQQWDNDDRVIITTKRLRLRPLRLADLDDFAPICADHKVMRFIAGGIQKKEKVAQNLAQWIAEYQRYGFGLLAVVMKKKQQFIGFCGLTRQKESGFSYIELGYRLASTVWDQGLGTEAAIAVRDYAFNALDIDHLYSFIHADNKASQRVAQKLGFGQFKEITHWGLPVNIYKLSRSQSELDLYSE